MIERRTPEPKLSSGVFQTNSLFGGIEGGLFAGVALTASAADDDEDHAEELEEKEERGALPVPGEAWVAHPGMFSAAGGFGNRNVFDRLEALNREEEEEDLE